MGASRDYVYRFDFMIIGKNGLQDSRTVFENTGW